MAPPTPGEADSAELDPTGSFEFVVTVEAEKQHGATVIVHGELDVSTAPRLQDRLYELIADGKHDITLDLAGMSFIDSTGLGVLVSTLKRTREAGGALVLRQPRPPAKKVFEISGLSQIVDIVD